MARDTERDNEVEQTESPDGRKAWSPERRAKFAATMAAKRKQRGGGTTAVVKAAPKIAIVRPVKPAQADGDVLAAIDAVIAAKQADVQTLEWAKEILSRG